MLALPQAGGHWTLCYADAGADDWDWLCETFAEADAVLMRIGKTALALGRMHRLIEVPRDHFRPPGGTPEFDLQYFIGGER